MLLLEGFQGWSKKDFLGFKSACERHGRRAYEQVCVRSGRGACVRACIVCVCVCVRVLCVCVCACVYCVCVRARVRACMQRGLPEARAFAV